MNLIYYCCTVLLLLINLAGLTQFMCRWLPTAALARIAGVLLLCALSFFVEHFYGFGQLSWLWPLTTVAAVMILYGKRHDAFTPTFWRAERFFVIAFAYGFAWKWAFPVIYPSSERVTDLYFISNYLPGQTLPPLDNWFPPHRFDFYYAFQHYAAALMGRILGLGPGLTYNLAFSLLTALSITLAWDFMVGLLKQPWKRLLVVLTFVIGGTGATPFVHLAYTNPDKLDEQQHVNAANTAMWASQRFIGSFDQQLNNEFGKKIFPSQAKPGWEPRELPLEGFGYQYYVGDYHPPLGGFLLLMVAIASIGALERLRFVKRHAIDDKQLLADTQEFSQPDTAHRYQFALQALLAFTVPLMIATNTWAFPLQSALVLGWIVKRYLDANPPNWKALFIGGGVGFLLLYPFLTGFASNALPTPIKWVQSKDHTPLVGFLAMHWPLLLFGILSLFAKSTRRLSMLFAVVFLGLLLVSELIYVDDPSGDKFERTNTVMKWWGWIWSGGLVTLATLLLASQVRWISIIVVLALLPINWYVLDIVNYWRFTDKSAAGQLAADTVYTRDATAKEMFGFLQQAPVGIVLENNYGGSFTDSGIYAAFAVKPTLLGWPMHLLTWHNSIDQAWVLKEQIIQFYTGKLPDSANWLLANKVDYIVWNTHDAQVPGAWEPIQNNIKQSYAWHEFQTDTTKHIGLWVRHK
ncbi:MAG: hypothetical protein HOP02_10620 [Methylococcaceae bacterium]|nr:hypothetical protein [Methylococcaceae bacterium]